MKNHEGYLGTAFGRKMNAILILVVIVALLLLAAIVGLLALWLGGSKIVILPGLGFAIGMPLLLALLIGVEVLVTISAVFLWRLSST